MKTISLIASVLVALPMTLWADCPNHQIEAAQKQATEEKKDLMMVISGSSWSEQSKKFDTEVLNVEEFKKGISGKFVPVVLDLPAKREDTHEQLIDLQTKYRFRQMPSLILADVAGRPYASTGMRKGSVVDYLKHLDELQAVRVERDRLIGEAGKAKGVEKAGLLVKALKSLPQEIVSEFYQAELVDIEKADPEGKTEYAREVRKVEALAKEQERYGGYFQKKEYERILKESREDAAKAKGEDSQRLLLYGVRSLADQKKFEEAMKAVEEMAKIDPQSGFGKRAERYQEMLKSAKERHENGGRPVAKRPTGPIVSKPVAVVTDIEELRKDAKEIDADLAKSKAKEKELLENVAIGSKEISRLEAELEKAKVQEKALAETLKKTADDSQRLSRKSEAMRDVIANHEAMEKRKREVAELEKRASDLRKQAEALREKASDIKKGK
ncbi:MAG: thioredoxin family protein [Akkermansiaceae bacterium]|jgi:hypothetical protein